MKALAWTGLSVCMYSIVSLVTARCVLPGPDQTVFILIVRHCGPKELCAIYLSLPCGYTEGRKRP